MEELESLGELDELESLGELDELESFLLHSTSSFTSCCPKFQTASE